MFIYSVSENAWATDCNADALADACAAGEGLFTFGWDNTHVLAACFLSSGALGRSAKTLLKALLCSANLLQRSTGWSTSWVAPWQMASSAPPSARTTRQPRPGKPMQRSCPLVRDFFTDSPPMHPSCFWLPTIEDHHLSTPLASLSLTLAMPNFGTPPHPIALIAARSLPPSTACSTRRCRLRGLRRRPVHCWRPRRGWDPPQRAGCV